MRFRFVEMPGGCARIETLDETGKVVDVQHFDDLDEARLAWRLLRAEVEKR